MQQQHPPDFWWVSGNKKSKFSPFVEQQGQRSNFLWKKKAYLSHISELQLEKEANFQGIIGFCFCCDSVYVGVTLFFYKYFTWTGRRRKKRRRKQPRRIMLLSCDIRCVVVSDANYVERTYLYLHLLSLMIAVGHVETKECELKGQRKALRQRSLACH